MGMLEQKHAIVINSLKYKVDCVTVDIKDGIEVPRLYEINDGESLVYIDISTANEMVKPRWDGDAWIETATPEEIKAAENAQLARLRVILPTLEELKAAAITETKRYLTQALERPMMYNGKHYSVTMEKQNLLSTQLSRYALNTQAGEPAALSWNATGEESCPWIFEDLLALSNAIDDYVTPMVKMQQATEIEIKACAVTETVNIVVETFKQTIAHII